VIVQSLYIKIF